MPTDEINKILGCIGRQVVFKYPETPEPRRGQLTDRAVFEAPCEANCVPYWDVVDLIMFNGEQEQCMRIGYYRKPGQKLVWGGQTTITEPVSVWKKMLVKVASEKPWFRELLEDVMKELENDDSTTH